MILTANLPFAEYLNASALARGIGYAMSPESAVNAATQFMGEAESLNAQVAAWKAGR